MRIVIGRFLVREGRGSTKDGMNRSGENAMSNQYKRFRSLVRRCIVVHDTLTDGWRNAHGAPCGDGELPAVQATVKLRKSQSRRIYWTLDRHAMRGGLGVKVK